MNNILKLFTGGIMAMGVVTCCVADTVDASDTADTTEVVEVVDTADFKETTQGTEITDSTDATEEVTDVATADVEKSQTVSARMDCKTIKAKINELSKGGPSDELSGLQMQYRKDCVVRATGLRSSYRGGRLTIAAASGDAKANAMASASSIKMGGAANENKSQATNAEVKISDAQIEMCDRLPDFIAKSADDVKGTLQATYDQYCKEKIAAPDAVVKTTMMVLGPAVPPETEEEKYARIVANLDAGLCPDGATPNKFGCCGDEKFKEIGNLEFACCPEVGECFPPIK